MADDDEVKIPINVKYWVGNETGIRFNEFYENEPYLAKDKESGNWQVYNVLIAALDNLVQHKAFKSSKDGVVWITWIIVLLQLSLKQIALRQLIMTMILVLE